MRVGSIGSNADGDSPMADREDALEWWSKLLHRDPTRRSCDSEHAAVMELR